MSDDNYADQKRELWALFRRYAAPGSSVVSRVLDAEAFGHLILAFGVEKVGGRRHGAWLEWLWDVLLQHEKSTSMGPAAHVVRWPTLWKVVKEMLQAQGRVAAAEVLPPHVSPLRGVGPQVHHRPLGGMDSPAVFPAGGASAPHSTYTSAPPSTAGSKHTSPLRGRGTADVLAAAAPSLLAMPPALHDEISAIEAAALGATASPPRQSSQRPPVVRSASGSYLSMLTPGTGVDVGGLGGVRVSTPVGGPQVAPADAAPAGLHDGIHMRATPNTPRLGSSSALSSSMVRDVRELQPIPSLALTQTGAHEDRMADGQRGSGEVPPAKLQGLDVDAWAQAPGGVSPLQNHDTAHLALYPRKPGTHVDDVAGGAGELGSVFHDAPPKSCAASPPQAATPRGTAYTLPAPPAEAPRDTPHGGSEQPHGTAAVLPSPAEDRFHSRHHSPTRSMAHEGSRHTSPVRNPPSIDSSRQELIRFARELIRDDTLPQAAGAADAPAPATATPWAPGTPSQTSRAAPPQTTPPSCRAEREKAFWRRQMDQQAIIDDCEQRLSSQLSNLSARKSPSATPRSASLAPQDHGRCGSVQVTNADSEAVFHMSDGETAASVPREGYERAMATLTLNLAESGAKLQGAEAEVARLRAELAAERERTASLVAQGHVDVADALPHALGCLSKLVRGATPVPSSSAGWVARTTYNAAVAELDAARGAHASAEATWRAREAVYEEDAVRARSEREGLEAEVTTLLQAVAKLRDAQQPASELLQGDLVSARRELEMARAMLSARDMELAAARQSMDAAEAECRALRQKLHHMQR